MVYRIRQIQDLLRCSRAMYWSSLAQFLILSCQPDIRFDGGTGMIMTAGLYNLLLTFGFETVINFSYQCLCLSRKIRYGCVGTNPLININLCQSLEPVKLQSLCIQTPTMNSRLHKIQASADLWLRSSFFWGITQDCFVEWHNIHTHIDTAIQIIAFTYASFVCGNISATISITGKI
jgi:hypothetical protein